MAKIKLNEKALRGNALGEIVLLLNDSAKHLSSIINKLEGCFVLSIETSEPIVDPFLAKSFVATFESDSTITQCLSIDAQKRLKTYVSSECDRMANSFEARLRPFCEKMNISLEGRFPKYFLSGFLEVIVEQTKGICRIGGKTIKSLMLESIAPAILEALKSEAERPFEAASFGKDLHEAYERVIKLKELNRGQPAQVLDVFRELVFVKQSSSFQKNPIKANYDEYVKEYFARDLARISASSSYVGGKRLELMPTAFPHEDGLPIRIGENVRYVGRLAFNEASS
ncbi:hypothetical protein ACFLUQ_00025 [Chloroflexota bacterium]